MNNVMNNVMKNKWVVFAMAFACSLAVYTLTSTRDAFWEYVAISLGLAALVTFGMKHFVRLTENVVRRIFEKR